MSILLERERSTTIPTNLQVFSTSPQSKDVPAKDYRNEVIKVARWSEDFGFTGILVYTDNALVDNWSVAQIILENTKHLAPLIAVQPIYMHPYMLAKRIATFAHIYGRKVYLNMLAGGFSNDLTQLGDNTPHDDRYARTVEYTHVIQGLLSSGDTAFNYEGKFYQLKNVKMSPTVPEELMPGILISGSSEAAIQASRDIQASLIRYPFPAEQEVQRKEEIAPGFRVGIIARASSDEAWNIAHERFPEDRRGQIAHQLAAKVSDSVWHKELTEQAKTPKSGAYWLGPFLNYQTFCPYLVGSYAEVADQMRAYQSKGFNVYIVDIPTSFEELQHIQRVYSLI